MAGRKEKVHNRNFSLKQRTRSFRFAFRGLKMLILYEHNARIHLVILVLVAAAGIYFHITPGDWLAILFVTGLVFASECFNTAVEHLSDRVTKEDDEKIRIAKDVAAAGVFISAVIAAITGVIIFLPEVIRLVH